MSKWKNPITNTELSEHIYNVKGKGMSQKASAKKLGRDQPTLARRLGWHPPETIERHRIQAKMSNLGLRHQSDLILSSDRTKCWITGRSFTPWNIVGLGRTGAVLPELEHCGKHKAFRGWTFGKLNTAMGNAGDDPARILRLVSYLKQDHFNVKWYPNWNDKICRHRPLYADCQRIFAMYDCCQNCGYVPPATATGSVDKLQLDHHHPTGMVRGVLCHGCNKAEGGFTKVAEYLGMEVERLIELSVEYLRKDLPC